MCILFLKQVVSGIAMPSGSDKLYTGSKDKTVRVWDCQSGQVRLNTFGCLVNRNSGWGTSFAYSTYLAKRTNCTCAITKLFGCHFINCSVYLM